MYKPEGIIARWHIRSLPCQTLPAPVHMSEHAYSNVLNDFQLLLQQLSMMYCLSCGELTPPCKAYAHRRANRPRCQQYIVPPCIMSGKLSIHAHSNTDVLQFMAAKPAEQWTHNKAVNLCLSTNLILMKPWQQVFTKCASVRCVCVTTSCVQYWAGFTLVLGNSPTHGYQVKLYCCFSHFAAKS